MDLTLRDALGGGGGVPAGAPADALLKRDFVASLEKESYDDKVGETISKSDFRPLVDGKDTKSGQGLMSSMMSSSGRQDPPGQSGFGPDYLSGPMMSGMSDQWSLNKTKDSSVPDSFLGFSQSGIGGPVGSGLPPFQTSMTPTLGQTGLTGMAPVMEPQKTSALFGVENNGTTNTSGSSPFKSSDVFSTGGPGLPSMDHSAAPILSPSGSVDDSSPTSSNSEPLSPERVGLGVESGKQQQRRRKKKKKGRDEVYDLLDSQENNVGHSVKHGMVIKGGREPEDDEDEEENWEWEIRESGGGGRVKGRKTKSRARIPEEWGAPQEPVSPTPAVVAPKWATAANSEMDFRPSSVLSSASEQIPHSVTNSHGGLADLSSRSYEPMCVDDFPVSVKDGQKVHDKNVLAGKPNANTATDSAGKKPGIAGDIAGSLALMTGENLSPVSQTFSFLDSVLQTPPGSTPDSQTTTPITHTPSFATPSFKSSLSENTSSVFSPSKSTSDFPPTSTSSTNPLHSGLAETKLPTTGTGLNVDAKPFVPSGAFVSSTPAPVLVSTGVPAPSLLSTTTAPSFTSEVSATSLSNTPPKSAAMSHSSTTPTPSITQAVPPSLPAQSKHQESSSPQLPSLEVKSDNKDKQELKSDIMSTKTDKIDTFDKKEDQQKVNSNDKNPKSEKILKNEEKVEMMNAEKNKANEKAEKTDKPEKQNKDEKKEEEKKLAEKKEEKGGKSTVKSPTGNGGKTLPSPDGKNKPDDNATKSNSAKSRPSTLPTNGEANSTKRPSPTKPSANKKSPAPKATTPTTAKRPPAATGPNRANKTPENSSSEKRTPVPKAAPTPRSTSNRNGSSTNNANKAAANKMEKTDKPGEVKKPKTTARPRPTSTTSPADQSASTNGDGTAAQRRRVITKPPVPKQTALEKKPPVPRAPRTQKPINAPTPDLKNVRSKIGSIDNIKYQPGGGKVSSTPNNKTSDPSTPTAKAKVQILNKKVDVSKVTSKCGSKDNIKHKPGGGDVKIESHKLNINAKSKIGSLDNNGQGNGQANGHKEEKSEKPSSPPNGAPATGPAGVAKATAPGDVAKENGMKEPAPNPFGGDGLRETLSSDKRITETN
ncbi:microtubule-associated protein 4-like isoform X2 [Gouania willdenowi]|uniref:Microtubule-associated protein n=1 Tax=Gouania willdenowi TaxID=441366 RepID=A0A8C5I443_GOUWI|nr:microtubule-associated protein 4-like isoform X2 [Gouania willdenowi]